MKATGLLSLACAAALTVACGGDTTTDRTVLDRDEPAVGTSGSGADDGGLFGTSSQEFVREMMASGSAEVQLGQLASQRASSPEVKQFGERMVQDHTKAGEQLKQIASRQGITTAAAIDDDHRELMDRLSKMKGAEFDREYMQAMVDSHEEVLDKLESRADDRTRSTSAGADVRDRAAADDRSPTAGRPEATGTAGQTPPPSAGVAGSPAGRDQTGVPAGQAGADATAMTVEQWAAQQVPIVREHLDRARSIHEKLGDRNTTANR